MNRWNAAKLAIYLVCFLVCLGLLAVADASGPLILLTIGAGLSLLASILTIICREKDSPDQQNQTPG